MKASIGVVVCDTYRLARDGIVRLLEEEPGITVLAECDRGEEALRLAREHQPDVLIVDLNVPDTGGMEVARRARGVADAASVAEPNNSSENNRTIMSLLGQSSMPRNVDVTQNTPCSGDVPRRSVVAGRTRQETRSGWCRATLSG